jgi:hypothetical protein
LLKKYQLLKEVGFAPAGVEELCHGIEEGGLASLTSLNLANNNLTAAAARALLRAAAGSRSTLLYARYRHTAGMCP